jgi:hypothetical protein
LGPPTPRFVLDRTHKQVAGGFNVRHDAENAFDSLIGLLGVIEVIDGGGWSARLIATSGSL